MHNVARPAACAVLWFFATSALAEGGWRSALGVNTALNFTDNVLLSQVDPESDVVLQLQPFLNSAWRGRVSSAQISYAPQFAVYANHGDLNRNWQYLRANATTEVVEDFVFLAATAQASPNVIDQGTATAGFDTVANPNAYTQTASFSIAPIFTFPIRASNIARVTFSPGLNLVLQGDTAGGSGTGTGSSNSSTGTATVLTIESGSYFQRMPWSLNYSSNLFDVGEGSGFTQVTGQVGYRFNPKYRIDMLVGVDDQYVGNNVEDPGAGRDLGNGLSWQPRFTWTPSLDTSATIGVGQAPYGNNYYLNVLRKQKRFAFSLSYANTIQNARQAILTQEVIPFQDPFGNPIFDPITGGQINQVVNTPTLVDETYVNGNLSALVAYKGKRTNVTFNAYVNWNTYQFSNVDTVQTTGSLTLQHLLSQKLSGRAVLLYRKYSSTPGEDQDYDQYQLELGMTYRLGRKTNAGVTYSLSQSSAQFGQGSSVAGGGTGSAATTQTGNYDENRIVLTFSTEL